MTTAKPTLAAINAALGDIKDAHPRQLASVLATFSTLAAAGDFLPVEAKALASLASHCNNQGVQLSQSESSAIRRFILQIVASPGRLHASAPTRTSLETHACGSAGQLRAILRASDVFPLVVLPGKEQKERSGLALEWLCHGATRSSQLELVEELFESAQQFGRGASPIATSAAVDASAIASVGFLLTAISKSEAQLALLAYFSDMVNVLFSHALPTARKLVSSIFFGGG